MNNYMKIQKVLIKYVQFIDIVPVPKRREVKVETYLFDIIMYMRSIQKKYYITFLLEIVMDIIFQIYVMCL